MSTTDTDVIEVLEPSVKNYEVIVGNRTYTQKPLSFFGKIELFSVLADVIEKALSEGITISELLDELPTDAKDLKANQVTETDVMIKGLAKVVKFAPDIFKDVTCISLRVDRGEREEFKIELEELEDEEAMNIVRQFIDQTWDAVMDFFSKQINPLIQNVSGKMQSRSTSSKPSKVSRQRTPKQ